MDTVKAGRPRVWTLERVKESALPFTNVTEWRAEFPSAVAAAYKNGWLGACTPHFTRKRAMRGSKDPDKLLAKLERHLRSARNNRMVCHAIENGPGGETNDHDLQMWDSSISERIDCAINCIEAIKENGTKDDLEAAWKLYAEHTQWIERH